MVQNGILGSSGDYRLGRIIAHFDKSAAYSDANLQQDNSIMAIASGKMWGKGLNYTGLESVKNGNFLAEEQTDFIFAIIGEELGFVGSLTVILLFAIAVFGVTFIFIDPSYEATASMYVNNSSFSFGSTSFSISSSAS